MFYTSIQYVNLSGEVYNARLDSDMKINIYSIPGQIGTFFSYASYKSIAKKKTNTFHFCLMPSRTTTTTSTAAAINVCQVCRFPPRYLTAHAQQVATRAAQAEGAATPFSFPVGVPVEVPRRFHPGLASRRWGPTQGVLCDNRRLSAGWSG